MIKAYLALWERLTATGMVKPTTHIMDNETSAEYKKAIRKNCTIQLVPPNNHRCNLAERAIQMFKSHFIAIFAGVDDTFPMRLWDKLLPQTIVTLNLLHQSNAVPSVSAYQYVRGTFDYNKLHLDQWEVQYKCMKAEITEAQGRKINRQIVSRNIIRTLLLSYHSRQENE